MNLWNEPWNVTTQQAQDKPKVSKQMKLLKGWNNNKGISKEGWDKE